MKRSSIVLSASLLMAASLPVHAGATTLATGGVYGGPKQHKAYCYVFNPTLDKTFYFDGFAIIKQDGTDVTSGATCYPGTHAPWLGILDPQRTCVSSAELETGSTYACRAILRTKWPGSGGNQGGKPNVRGTMDIRDAEENVLNSSPLH